VTDWHDRVVFALANGGRRPTREETRGGKYAPEGSRVLCGYWHREYDVLAHEPDGSVTIRWVADGRVANHRTPIDRHDVIIEGGAIRAYCIGHPDGDA
jgi:hypothetical protein